MKIISPLLLAICASGISVAAYADNDTITVHFNGTVTQPTCGFNNPNQDVKLEPVRTSDLQNVAIGKETDVSNTRFSLAINCSSKMEAEHIVITLNANKDNNNADIIANTEKDNGVGLKLFTEDGRSLALNKEIPPDTYIDRLNEGGNNINYVVKYARLRQDVSGGNVAGDATFVVTYK